MLHSIHVDMTIAYVSLLQFKVQYHLKSLSGFLTAHNYFQYSLYTCTRIIKKIRRRKLR